MFMEKLRFRRGLSMERPVFMEKLRFRRGVSMERPVFVDKLRFRRGLSMERPVFVEKGGIAARHARPRSGISTMHPLEGPE